MENENDYELVREPKPKGYVRLTRRKPPFPTSTHHHLKKKPVSSCWWLLPFWLLFAIAIAVLLYCCVSWCAFQFIRYAYAREQQQWMNE
jgi:hypothetical protein